MQTTTANPSNLSRQNPSLKPNKIFQQNISPRNSPGDGGNTDTDRPISQPEGEPCPTCILK